MISGTDDTVSGVTYISLDTDDFEELGERLVLLCKGRKYLSKGDVWVGFGSLKSSSKIIDVVVFNNQKWEYNQELESVSKILFEGKNQGTKMMLGKKNGRNDKCLCGSGLKHKKCCGRK